MLKSIDVRDIVHHFLKGGGYDGLCNGDYECGCDVDDLFPCGEACADCYPGYSRTCPECPLFNTEKCDLWGEYDGTGCYHPEKLSEERKNSVREKKDG